MVFISSVGNITCTLLRKSFTVVLKTQPHYHLCLSCTSSLHTHSNANHHLLPPFTNTDIKPPINFSSIFHLKHIFTPHTELALSPAFSFPISSPSSLHKANSPGDGAGEILMCSVKCCCLECCPDHKLCFWTEQEAKQPFRGLRQRSTLLDVTAGTTPSRALISLSPALCSMQMIHDCDVKPNQG